MMRSACGILSSDKFCSECPLEKLLAREQLIAVVNN
jgi:hypothetical protein